MIKVTFFLISRSRYNARMKIHFSKVRSCNARMKIAFSKRPNRPNNFRVMDCRPGGRKQYHRGVEWVDCWSERWKQYPNLYKFEEECRHWKDNTRHCFTCARYTLIRTDTDISALMRYIVLIKSLLYFTCHYYIILELLVKVWVELSTGRYRSRCCTCVTLA